MSRCIEGLSSAGTLILIVNARGRRITASMMTERGLKRGLRVKKSTLRPSCLSNVALGPMPTVKTRPRQLVSAVSIDVDYHICLGCNCGSVREMINGKKSDIPSLLPLFLFRSSGLSECNRVQSNTKSRQDCPRWLRQYEIGCTSCCSSKIPIQSRF